MNGKFMVEVPDSSTMKADEIQTLKKIASNFCRSQSYLAMLFSKDLVEWFETQVRQDFSTDLMSYHNSHLNDLAKAEHALRDTQNEMMVHVDAENTLFNKVTKLEETINNERAHFSNEIETKRNAFMDAKSEIRSLKETIEDLQKELEISNETINNLKIRCFDLQEKLAKVGE